MATMSILVMVCNRVLGIYKLEALGALMSSIESITYWGQLLMNKSLSPNNSIKNPLWHGQVILSNRITSIECQAILHDIVIPLPHQILCTRCVPCRSLKLNPKLKMCINDNFWSLVFSSHQIKGCIQHYTN